MTVILIIVYVAIVGYALYALQQQNQRAVRMEEEIKQKYWEAEQTRAEKNGEPRSSSAANKPMD